MATARRVEARIGPPDDSPVLQDFYASRGDVDIVIGPLGSGKTFGVLQRNLLMASQQKPNSKGVRLTRCGVLRNSWPELETATLPDIERFFGPMGARITRGIPPSMVLEARLGDGTTMRHEMVFVAGLDQPDSEEKLRGHQWTWVWANEMRQIPLGVFGMAIARTGRYPTEAIDGANPTWRGGLGDTNAFDVDHPLYKLMQERPAGWNFFVQPPGIVRASDSSPWNTNPKAENLANLAPDYYERISKGRPDDWIRVNLANEFIFHIDGKPVHPQYNDAVHCAALPPKLRKDLPLVLGVDFGRTPAATVWQYDTAMDRWTGHVEFVTEGMSASLFAPALRRWLDREFAGMPVYAWGDPAGDRSGQTVETTPIQVLRAHGIPSGPAPSNQVLLRRGALAKPMMRVAMDGKPAFVISPAMRMLRKGLQGGFHYKRMHVAGTERYTEEPDKNEFSHVVESAEYALLGGGERATWRDSAYTAGDDEDEDVVRYAEMSGT
jgi:hypothetical protein